MVISSDSSASFFLRQSLAVKDVIINYFCLEVLNVGGRFMYFTRPSVVCLPVPFLSITQEWGSK